MKKDDILKQTTYRTWPISKKPWVYYQEWHDVVFLHAQVEMDWLKQQVPAGLTIELFDGSPWISIVAFKVKGIRPRFAPPVGIVSNFNEINIRTYVTAEGKPGVYFLKINADKSLSSKVARLISGLPYEYNPFTFRKNSIKADWVAFDFTFNKPVDERTKFDIWATERYCLYNRSETSLYRYSIHHIPWPLCTVNVSNFQANLPFEANNQFQLHERAHYSPEVQVLVWPMERIKS